MIGIGTVMAMAMAGIIVGCINAPGLAFNLSLAMTSLGENNVFLLLVCAAVASLILGMGMPSVAAYSLVAPSLIEFGIPAMAAHLVVFYFSVISNITPRWRSPASQPRPWQGQSQQKWVPPPSAWQSPPISLPLCSALSPP